MSRDEQNPTTDLTRFGKRELRMAGELLIAFCDQGADYLGDGVQVWMNIDSGKVFLSDEDFNVGMMNGDKLEQWFSCPSCGYEEFKDGMNHEGDNDCKEYLEQIGVLKKTGEIEE